MWSGIILKPYMVKLHVLLLKKGREHERKHRYAHAEDEYVQITDDAVREMTLNQLASAWESVNANIIHAQERVQQQTYAC